MKLRLSAVIVFVFIGQLLFSQSKSEIVEYGDNAYKNENYASAAYFYKKIIDKKGVASGLVHPYEAGVGLPLQKKTKQLKILSKVPKKLILTLIKGMR